MNDISSSPIFCEHANEMPSKCPCPENCYCKSHSCRPKCGFCGSREFFKEARGNSRCLACMQMAMARHAAKAMDATERPEPLPRRQHDAERFDELLAAMARRREANKRVSVSWVKEFCLLADSLLPNVNPLGLTTDGPIAGDWER